MKKAKLVTTEHIDDLKEWWDAEGYQAYQADKAACIARDGKEHRSCNGHTNSGWTVGGSAGYTRLVKAAGLPYNQYWSGSCSTPSTQYPGVIYDHLVKMYPEYR
jgi:hypothetical protein